MENDKLQERTEAIFKTHSKELRPHPFLKTRVLANFREHKKKNDQQLLWKWASAILTLCLVLTISLNQNHSPKMSVDRPYVIHMDFTAQEATEVVMAEIELPENVSFYSEKNPYITGLKKLILPVKASSDGRTRLPFIVKANKAGNKEIKIRLFNENNEIIKDDAIKVSFSL